jgi:hypothetical protein
MKRRLILILSILLIFSGSATCINPNEHVSTIDLKLQAIYDAIDIDFSVETATAISSFGTHPELGYRLAGSSGENEAVYYLYGRFKEAGLKKVTVYETEVDTWSMTKSDLYYTDQSGEKRKITLGAYPTTFISDNETFEMIYLNEGTAADYEGVDATDKVVLVDIDQNNNWWINWPAYQAYLKGAKCIIATNYDSYGQKDGDTIVSQDTCGPSYAPALSISKNDADILKELILNSDTGSIEVTIDCDAQVIHDGTSHNIAGVIPGRTDDIIFLMGHIDGYYHAWHDDASGLAMALSIGKAIIDSGYRPEKTIIIIGHGAEEWGIDNSRYDWAVGAYEQIFNITPDWANTGFAVINCESGCARDDDNYLCISSTYELKNFLEDIVKPMSKDSPWEEDNQIHTPPTVWTEDFSYSLAGVPGMVTKKTSGHFNLNTYHSNRDLQEDHYSEEHYLYSHILYSTILYELDKANVIPLDFTTRLEALIEDIAETCPKGAELTSATEDVLETARSVKEKIAKINSGNLSKRRTRIINNNLRSTYKFAQNNLLALDWEDNVVFPHSCVQNNIALLEASIKSLSEGDIPTVIDEYLFDIDYNWYAYAFDHETYQFFVNQTLEGSDEKLVWGKGMIKQGNEDLHEVITSLKQKYDSPGADVSFELNSLKAALENQKIIGEKLVQQEIEDLYKLKELLEKLL